MFHIYIFYDGAPFAWKAVHNAHIQVTIVLEINARHA